MSKLARHNFKKCSDTFAKIVWFFFSTTIFDFFKHNFQNILNIIFKIVWKNSEIFWTLGIVKIIRIDIAKILKIKGYAKEICPYENSKKKLRQIHSLEINISIMDALRE